VIDSPMATVGVWSYGLACVGYVLFSIRVSLGARGAGARLLLGALITTALWAAVSMRLAIAPSQGTALLAGASETLRDVLWFVFLMHLLKSSSERRGVPVIPRAVGWIIGVAVLAVIALFGWTATATLANPIDFRIGFFLRIGLAVFGLMLVEHLVRRIQPQFRWSVKPLAVALGGMFGLDLYLYADAALFGHLQPDIWASRGFASVIVIPFLAIATARNTGWTVDLHLSRRAVFHSTALVISGVFLLLVAAAGYYVRYFGGTWGRALQIELLFAAALAVVLVATSGRFRARLKVFISKHFFSYRYDYREEWLRFTRTLAAESTGQAIHERTITALADIIESPSGAVWLLDEARGYVPAARWNIPSIIASEAADSAFVSFLSASGWIVEIPEVRAHPDRYEDLTLPAWLDSIPSAWLILPLSIGAELIGFVVLTAPRAPLKVDWEVRDLLKAASRQAASYLGHVRTSEALLEARKFESFNRMSAFVVHDLKNLVAQLSLMLKNAGRHRDNPAFQADMISTVQHVVERMNSLMLQLRAGAEPVDNPRSIDLVPLVRRVCAAKSDQQVRVQLAATTARVMALGHEQRLEHVIGHLLQNAIDASHKGDLVEVSLELQGRFASVTITDHGAGMTPEFMRDRLFKPFQTTKQSGMGIGVYESVKYVSALGGDLSVESRPGIGTVVRVLMPAAERASDNRDVHEHAI
jgi:putative PEP-CTERM system histidine kinase